MNNSEAKVLLRKYLDGSCTETETAWIETWYLQHSLPDVKVLTEAERIEDIESILNSLAVNSNYTPKVFVKRLWSRKSVIAATITILLGASLYLYIHPLQFISGPENRNYTNDIDAGKEEATLTLANGKKIRLSKALKGELANESGVSISKTANGQIIYNIMGNATQDHNNFEKIKYNTLSTANGETYQVKLPDGTLIWLNAASSVKYPASFIGMRKRIVEMEGEAYFEVKKDKHIPFIVKTAKQEVEVLGTHFNVNSYADETNIKTTLLEGSVRVSSLAGSSFITLKPNQQSVLTVNNQINVKQVDAEDVTDWKNGDFIFKGEDFKTAMRRIARWYDVEVIYQNSDKINLDPRGWVSRKSSILSVLKMIESTGNVHFKIEGRRVIVTN